jgi:hypothetical protein
MSARFNFLSGGQNAIFMRNDTMSTVPPRAVPSDVYAVARVHGYR